jgi:hypothetical protein
MPGSPPTSTNEPGIIPPPNTLSNSEIFVLMRYSLSVEISFNVTTLADFNLCEIFFCCDVFLDDTETSSTKEFHSLQLGHFPNQRGDSVPQLLQI